MLRQTLNYTSSLGNLYQISFGNPQLTSMLIYKNIQHARRQSTPLSV